MSEAFRTRWYIGLRAALCVGIPLLAGVAAGRASWGALASMGGFAGFYGPDTPYRHRIRIVAGVGVALAIVVPLSSLCAPYAWLSVLVGGTVAGAAAFVCLALRVPPPREYLILLAMLAATGIPAAGPAALREFALVAAGAVLGGLISMAPLLGGRRAVPATKALDQAWEAVHDVLATAGTPGATRCRGRAVAAVSHACETLRQAGRTASDELLRSLAAVELALAGALSASVDAAEPLDSAAISRVLDMAEASRRHATVTPLDSPDVAARLRAGLRRDSVAIPAAARIAVTVAVGIALGRVLGVEHSYWIALTAVAALQANNVTFLVRRSLHRLVGTIAGVAIGGIVFVAHPTLAVIAIVATAAQFAGEVLISASYGLAIVFVTVVALSIYDLGVPAARIAAAVGARVLDTLIGVALVIVLRLLLWWRATGTRLPQVQALTLRATADVFRARWLDGREADLRPALRRLEEHLLSMRTLTDDAIADAILGPRETRAEQISLAIDELAVLGLGIPFGRERPTPEQASALVDRLDRLAQLVADGSASADSRTMPGPVDLPAYPRTRAATELLATAIAGPAR